MADIEELARRFAASGTDHRKRSPFYAGLNRQIATDPDIISLLTAAPEEQQLPVLLLAAVHSIVLDDPELDLAQWYATTSAAPLDSDPFPAFARLCTERDDEIRQIVASKSVQTNEVGRCALLLPGLAAIGQELGPISLIDVGASAGLNLLLDRYQYRYDPGGCLGDPSAVRLECSTRDEPAIPTTMPVISERLGLDRAPIDVSDIDAARWLAACVWPDQTDRFVRLRAAIDIARRHPPDLRRGDALELLAPSVRAARGGHPVVTTSWALNYLTRDQQHEFVAIVDELGRELDLSWVSAESPGLCPGIPFPAHVRDEHITAQMVTRWRNGKRTEQHLGTAHPHGYWWHAPAPGTEDLDRRD